MPEESKDEKRFPLDFEREPVAKDASVELRSGSMNYTVSTGMLPIRNEFGEPEAGIFYIAYAKKGDHRPEERPLMFSFNGGPGSSSVWLHLGAVGPKRVEMLDDGNLPPPPYKLTDNAYTWLEDADLVFIDPVGTGYSRAATKELEEKFYGVKGDIECLSEFIRLYLTRANRWSSPLFLVGESYGTTRAAGLAGHLIDRGVAFNGILLVSSILNFQTAGFAKGNDLPYVLFLPTYAATAWYHKRVPAERQADLKTFLDEVEDWAETEYTLALAKGDRLTSEERKAVVERLALYTGLKPEYVENSDLRIGIHEFCKELLRDERRTVGRLDSRFKGIDERGVTHVPDYDPSMSAIRPPYTAMLNDYLRREIGWETDTPYYILGEGAQRLWEKWDWGSARSGHPDTSEALRAAFAKNPYMKVFVASGYYDLATPYFATEYTLNHMGLDPSFRDSITTAEYEAGHMMYIHTEMLKKLKDDVSSFIRQSIHPV
jgi:carboxypeptidase C (cathepsin A)